jgi:hypothetical protein
MVIAEVLILTFSAWQRGHCRPRGPIVDRRARTHHLLIATVSVSCVWLVLVSFLCLRRIESGDVIVSSTGLFLVCCRLFWLIASSLLLLFLLLL